MHFKVVRASGPIVDNICIKKKVTNGIRVHPKMEVVQSLTCD